MSYIHQIEEVTSAQGKLVQEKPSAHFQRNSCCCSFVRFQCACMRVRIERDVIQLRDSAIEQIKKDCCFYFILFFCVESREAVYFIIEIGFWAVLVYQNEQSKSNFGFRSGIKGKVLSLVLNIHHDDDGKERRKMREVCFASTLLLFFIL